MIREDTALSADGDEQLEIIEALQKATIRYRICPNRIWAIASSLPEKEAAIPILFPPADKRLDEMIAGQREEDIAEHHKHDFCTASFCEQAQVNFTSVAQRHESPHCKFKACSVIEDRFQARRLNMTAEAGRPTAWTLSGRRSVVYPETYMAISHVWSDGTGTGAWTAGQVHKCLYNFFRSLARLFDCDGIWWDTICVPADRSARVQAIKNMHENYAGATVTLLHDCFLRNLPWIDAETACLAIIISPWFGRGWTALELAKSRKVMVLFKANIGCDNSPTIKDLDQDILQVPDDPTKDPRSHRHRIAADTIVYLRNQEITSLNQLLKVLGSRHTSWTRDMAVISGLLVGATISDSNNLLKAASPRGAADTYQQAIYQRVLRKIGRIGHETLFHNQPTLFRGTSWCPANIISMPLATTENLKIDEHGNVIGQWKVANMKHDLGEAYLWTHVHPSTKVMLQAAMKDDVEHFTLIEPDFQEVMRVLLVKDLGTNYRNFYEKAVQFVGPLYFRSALKIGEKPGLLKSIVILNSSTSNIRTADNKRKRSESGLNSIAITQRPTQHARSYQRSGLVLYQSQQKPLDDIVRFLSNTNGSRLHNKDLYALASEGKVSEFQNLLAAGADPRCRPRRRLRSVISYAAEHGHVSIIKCCEKWYEDWCNAVHNFDAEVLHKALTESNQDRGVDSGMSVVELLNTFAVSLFNEDYPGGDKHRGISYKSGRDQFPIGWATTHGHIEVVEQLLKWYEVQIDRAVDHPSLWEAFTRNNLRLVELLVKNGADIKLSNSDSWSLLGRAACTGNLEAVNTLLKGERAGVNITASDGRTALSWACAQGHIKVVEALLAAEDVDVNLPDNHERQPLSYAAEGGFVDVVKRLLKREEVDVDVGDMNHRTPLWYAAYHDHKEMVMELLAGGAKTYIHDLVEMEPLSVAAGNGCRESAEALLKNGLSIHKTHLQWLGKPLSELPVGLEYPPQGPGKCLPYGAYADMVKAEDYRGLTALSWAAWGGHLNIIQLIERENEYMQAIIDYSNNGNFSMEDAECHAEGVREKFDTSLAPASEPQFLRPDNGKKASVSFGNRNRTPLSWAAEAGHEDVVRHFLSDRQQVLSIDADGRTPLWWAVHKGHTSIVRLMINRGDIQLTTGDLEKLRETAFRDEEEGWDQNIRLIIEDAVMGRS